MRFWNKNFFAEKIHRRARILEMHHDAIPPILAASDCASHGFAHLDCCEDSIGA
jgi:hypothetical protein